MNAINGISRHRPGDCPWPGHDRPEPAEVGTAHRPHRLWARLWEAVLVMAWAISAMGASAFAPAYADAAVAGLKPCLPHELQVRRLSDDAAMGGVRRIDYAFVHPSAGACTLTGYPRFVLLKPATGPKRYSTTETARNRPADPQTSVRLDPGNTAVFSVYYNAGGAGYTGNPCPVFHTLRITPPGSRAGWIRQESLTLCRGLEVSAVR